MGNVSRRVQQGPRKDLSLVFGRVGFAAAEAAEVGTAVGVG